jgi:hypothetical protein
MFEHRDRSNSQFKTCEVDADDFELYEGDIIVPGFKIGIDIRTGAAIYMEKWGRVATVYYNPMNHSFLVMVQLLTSIENRGKFDLEEFELIQA